MTKMRNIARKFVAGVGFSNGCALFALKKPPPFVPNCLIASCDATGPCAIVCVPAPSSTVTTSYGFRFCTTPCDTKTRATTTQTGSRIQSRPRVVSTQKLPIVSCSRRAMPRMKATASAMPDRRRDEVVVRQAGHLGEIAHRRLAGVPLPVRVGRERCGGVERGMRRHRAEALRIERQPSLQALQRVQDQHRDAAERQQRRRVLGPAHLRVGRCGTTR